MRLPRSSGALVLLALALPCAAADRLVLQGGAVAEGVVVKDGADEVVLRQGDREVRVPRAKVLRVELDASGPVADEMLAARLGAEIIALRVAAGDEILRTWPASRGTLDFALRHTSAVVRLEATHLLARPEVTDYRDRLVLRLGDHAPEVRMIALRGLRTRDVKDAEPRVIELAKSDVEASVRNEAILTLEAVGTVACLDTVLAQFTREEGRSARRRMLRVLRRVTAEDAGEDPAAWQAVVDRAKERDLKRRARAAGGPGAAPEPAEELPAAPKITLKPMPTEGEEPAKVEGAAPAPVENAEPPAVPETPEPPVPPEPREPK